MGAFLDLSESNRKTLRQATELCSCPPFFNSHLVCQLYEVTHAADLQKQSERHNLVTAFFSCLPYLYLLLGKGAP